MNKLILLSLILFSSCSFKSNRVKKYLGNDKYNIAHFYFEHSGAKMPVWLKGNASSDIVIVFLAGGPGSPSLDYRIALKPLEEKYMICYYDQRCSGYSKGKPKHLTLDRFTEDLEILIAKLKHIKPTAQFVLFGHSWGGYLAGDYLSKGDNQTNIAAWIDMDGVCSVPLLFKSSQKMIMDTVESKLRLSADSVQQALWNKLRARVAEKM